MKYLISFAFLSLLLFSCAGETKPEEKTDTKTDTETTKVEETKQDCMYTIAGPKTTTLTWTAYKFTNKVGVSGVFDNVYVSGKLRQERSIPKMLEKTAFYIATGSINSKNEERDPKIIKSFFGNILKGDSISGNIISANGTNSVGKCEANLKFNGMEKVVFLDYTFENEKIKLTGGFNLEDWNAKDAVASLNEVCSDLHKGEDQVSKLWPDIDLVIESPIKVRCE